MIEKGFWTLTTTLWPSVCAVGKRDADLDVTLELASSNSAPRAPAASGRREGFRSTIAQRAVSLATWFASIQ